MTQSYDSPAVEGFEGLDSVCDCLGLKESGILSSLGQMASLLTKTVKYVVTVLLSFETPRGGAYK